MREESSFCSFVHLLSKEFSLIIPQYSRTQNNRGQAKTPWIFRAFEECRIISHGPVELRQCALPFSKTHSPHWGTQGDGCISFYYVSNLFFISSCPSSPSLRFHHSASTMMNDEFSFLKFSSSYLTHLSVFSTEYLQATSCTHPTGLNSSTPLRKSHRKLK